MLEEANKFPPLAASYQSTTWLGVAGVAESVKLPCEQLLAPVVVVIDGVVFTVATTGVLVLNVQPDDTTRVCA